MTTLLLLYAPAVLFPIIGLYLWRRRINLVELCVYVLVTCLIVTVGWHAGTYGNAIDTQVLNGEVTKKYKEKTNCTHSYSCNCTTSCTGSGTTRSCTTTCQTCYEHSHDFDWILQTTVGNIDIDRIDRQGVSEPPRFTAAKPGDPVASTRTYINYIKAASDSLFNSRSNSLAMEKFGNYIPRYPLEVYDYHYIDRVLFDRINVLDAKLWNSTLAKALITLGPSKQANVVILITREADTAYAQAVHSAWLGGKKNDVIVVIGSPDYPNISWVQVLSWSDKEILKVSLRDSLMDLKTLSADTVIPMIYRHIDQQFVRKPMEDFKYLTEQFEAPDWLIGIIIFLAAAIGLVLPYFLREPGTKRTLKHFNKRKY